VEEIVVTSQTLYQKKKKSKSVERKRKTSSQDSTYDKTTISSASIESIDTKNSTKIVKRPQNGWMYGENDIVDIPININQSQLQITPQQYILPATSDVDYDHCKDTTVKGGIISNERNMRNIPGFIPDEKLKRPKRAFGHPVV